MLPAVVQMARLGAPTMAKATTRPAEQHRRQPEPALESTANDTGADLADVGADGTEVAGANDRARLASPEEFFERMTERADVRGFLKRLADR